MNIRTKVITTIIAMVCSLSVSATGIAAIMMQFNIQVTNTTSIEMGDIKGDLYGERYGADNQDLVMQHLFKNGTGVQEAEMNYFCRDVNFSTDSNQIEYIFKFVLAENAGNGVLIQLTEADLTSPALFTDDYKIAYGKTEPDWNKQNNLVAGANYVVDNKNPYVWIRATLTINKDAYQRIGTEAVWTFSLSFTGIQVNTES